MLTIDVKDCRKPAVRSHDICRRRFAALLRIDSPSKASSNMVLDTIGRNFYCSC